MEVNVVKLDVAKDASRIECLWPVGNFWNRIHQRKDALTGGQGMLQLSVDPRHFLDRPEHEHDV
jgi:hypothetical protein